MLYYLYLRDDAIEVEIDVAYSAIYRPAKLSGPPENCYPDESEMELDGYSILNIQTPPEEAPVTKREIQSAFDKDENRIIDACWEDFHERRYA
jgi:hypothetical protein